LKVPAAVTPVVLIALATGALAYAYLVDRGTVSDADRVVRRRDVFPSFRVDEVEHVELAHGAEKLVLERDRDAGSASSWTMKSPVEGTADSAGVDSLLRELETATWVRRVTDGDGLGLASPRTTGEVVLGHLEYRFALGADAAKPEGAAYLKLEGEGTFVVGHSLAAQLLRGADAYRERAIVPYGGNSVTKVEVQAAQSGGSPASPEGFRLERHGATLRTDKGLRVSRAVGEQVLAALADVRADVFLDDAAADAATTVPALTASVNGQGSDPEVKLRVGAACPGRPDDVVVVRTSPGRMSACVPRGFLDRLRPPPDGIVDASPLFARADEIDELRIEAVGTEGPTVDVARKSTTWRERAPEARDLSGDEGDSVSALVARLVEARGTHVRLPGSTETFAPVSRLSIVRTGGATRELVELSRPLPDGTALLRRADDGAVLVLPAADARHFTPLPVALRARSLWHAPFDPAAVTAIRDTCGAGAQELELRGDTWKMIAPAGFRADGVSVADIAGAVARAKVDAWVADADDGTFGLHGPGACSIEVTISSAQGQPPRRATIAFGSTGEGGVYARTLDDPSVFVAPAVLHAMLTHPAIDRGAFRVDPADLASLTVATKGREVRWVRHGTTLEREGAAPEDAGAGDAVTRATSALYAIAALHPGATLPGEGLEHPLEIVASRISGVTTRITIGAPVQVDGVDSYFARVRGVDATFAVPKAPVDALLSAR
jgi:hypothetical protein